METTAENQSRYEIQLPGLPLAVYREIAAHLRQVQGVETGLTPQQSPQFDYDRSQVGSLWIQYTETADRANRQMVDRILAYYQQKYGAWEVVPE